MSLTNVEVENLMINGILTNKGCVPLTISFKSNIDDKNSSVSKLFKELRGVSKDKLYYSCGILSINFAMQRESLRYGCGVVAYNYIHIPATKMTKKLDLDITNMDTLVYRCHCHKVCYEKYSCKGLCKKRCECGGIDLPDISNFKPFDICEGHSNDKSLYIHIDSVEKYNKYKQIPYMFRYKHKYINANLDIDFTKYYKNYSAKYTFSVAESIVKIGAQYEYPLLSELLDVYPFGDITKIMIEPKYSPSIYSDIEEIKSITLKTFQTIPMDIYASIN